MNNTLITKHRPKCFGQVVGHDKEIEAIVKNISTNNLQTMLFVGLRGTGKTTTARLVCSWLNCKNKDKKFDVVCNCVNCVSVRNGNLSGTLLEYDAATITGIDGIRSLQEDLMHHPLHKCRVIIIDECHKLSNSAQNALLKVTEDVPKNTLFILCTTELEKVLQPLVSRAVQHFFNDVDDKLIKNVLSDIADKECIRLEDRYFELLSKHSNGSVRDGISLLSKISQIEEITEDTIYSLIGGVSTDKLADLFLAVFSYDTTQALIELKGMFDSGTQPDNLYKAIEDFLQTIIYGIHNLTDGNLELSYQNIVNMVSDKDVSKFLKCFWNIKNKTYGINKLFFDVVVIDYYLLDFTEPHRKTEYIEPKKVTLHKPKKQQKPILTIVEDTYETLSF